MTKHQTEIDRNPFRSKADREREALENRYRQIAIPAVVAAVQHTNASEPSKQMS